MEKEAIRKALVLHHEAFTARVTGMPAERRATPRNGKWSPTQHLEHIRMSVDILAKGMAVPKWVLRWRFGTPNRPPRDFDALVARYREKLTAGGKAPARFAPKALRAEETERASGTLHVSLGTLIARMQRWSDRDLDTVLLTHPLLGKLTAREMLLFTIYHVQHHHALVDRDYA